MDYGYARRKNFSFPQSGILKYARRYFKFVLMKFKHKKRISVSWPHLLQVPSSGLSSSGELGSKCADVFFTYIIMPLLFTEAHYYYLKYKDSSV